MIHTVSENNSESLLQDQNPQNSDNHISWDLFENLDRQEKIELEKKQWDLHKLREIFSHLFWTEYLWNYCCYTKNPKQCSDWSDLYSIIKYNWQDTIIKVWAWEFNTDVFNTWWVKKIKWFYNTPIPLFVVNQTDSYFADEEQQELRINNSKEYLNKFAVIIVPKWWKAYYRWYQDRKKDIDFWPINIRHFDDTLASGRLAILQKEFPNWQFQECLKIIEKLQEMDFEKFYNTIYKNEQYLDENRNKLLWCFWNMWVNRVWSWVWDKKAYKSLYDLIISFNLQKQSF